MKLVSDRAPGFRANASVYSHKRRYYVVENSRGDAVWQVFRADKDGNVTDWEPVTTGRTLEDALGKVE